MSKKIEGKLYLNYVYASTKIEEFIINFSRTCDLLVQLQFDMPNTMERYYQITDGLVVDSEEQAAEALLKLEEIVKFNKGSNLI